MNVLIVESPGKIKKIKYILGKDYEVTACFGHVMDLPPSSLGIDLKTMQPIYQQNKKTISKLKKITKNAKNVYVASDDDREGEFIGYSLVQSLHLKKYTRIVFHEITKSAVQKSFDNQRQLNMDLIYAQQCRRIIDRLLGYKLSPILKSHLIENNIIDKSKKIGCGRVQSVVVRMIYDSMIQREESLKNDTSMTANVMFNDLPCKLCDFNLQPLKCSFELMEKMVSCIKYVNDRYEYVVSKIYNENYKSYPPPPFTTSTLQQDSYTKLRFTPDKTMSIAQKLYEKGLITYMRTDSNHLSFEAINQAKSFITDNFGEEYIQTKMSNQNKAHEAIRPTNINNKIEGLCPDSSRLYELIKKRTIQSQMIPATNQTTNIIINANQNFLIIPPFLGAITKCIEKGYKIYDNDDEDIEYEINVEVNDLVSFNGLTATESINNVKTLYNQSALIKQLDKNKIGRPSTYASSIMKNFEYKYIKTTNIDGIEKEMRTITLGKDIKISKKNVVLGGEKQKIIITDLGKHVIEFLIQRFEQVVDYKFTADMESKLDDIANKKLNHMTFLMEIKSFMEDLVGKL